MSFPNAFTHILNQNYKKAYDSSSNSVLSSLSQTIRNSKTSFLTHAEDNDLLAWEGMTLPKAMMAGSLAGMTEHACMFPVDTIKTRMQISQVPGAPVYTNLWRAIKDVAKNEGFGRLYRGLPAVALAAIPSHALYFGTFEVMKEKLGSSRSSFTPFASAVSGICATLAHDSVSTPMDVVKQRMQLYGSKYTSIRDCIMTMWKNEGLIAFYQSYVTTVLLNVPYVVVHFVTYEGMHTLLHDTAIDDTPVADILSGACAGGLGALFSNPLDVVKTRLQTQVVAEGQVRLGMVDMIKDIWTKEGIKGFGHGASARVTMFIPSAAICWTIYEGLKRFMLPNYDASQGEKPKGSSFTSDSKLGNM